MNDNRIPSLAAWFLAGVICVLGRLKARWEEKIGWDQEGTNLRGEHRPGFRGDINRDIKAVKKAELRRLKAEIREYQKRVDPRFKEDIERGIETV